MGNLERLRLPSGAFSINRGSVAPVPYVFRRFLLSILGGRSLQKMDARCSAVFVGVPLTPLDRLF